MSGPVLPGYAESGDYTEREKEAAEKSVLHGPREDCANERQGGEQSKVTRLGIHSCLALALD
jgi:hypothetical protein